MYAVKAKAYLHMLKIIHYKVNLFFIFYVISPLFEGTDWQQN